MITGSSSGDRPARAVNHFEVVEHRSVDPPAILQDERA
jgi:hypothetical protein